MGRRAAGTGEGMTDDELRAKCTDPPPFGDVAELWDFFRQLLTAVPRLLGEKAALEARLDAVADRLRCCTPEAPCELDCNTATAEQLAEWSGNALKAWQSACARLLGEKAGLEAEVARLKGYLDELLAKGERVLTSFDLGDAP